MEGEKNKRSGMTYREGSSAFFPPFPPFPFCPPVPVIIAPLSFFIFFIFAGSTPSGVRIYFLCFRSLQIRTHPQKVITTIEQENGDGKSIDEKRESLYKWT